MFESVTATGVVAAAGDFADSIAGILLIVIGFGVLLTLSSWVIAKFRGRRGGRRRK